jgi:hypothetical protein
MAAFGIRSHTRTTPSAAARVGMASRWGARWFLTTATPRDRVEQLVLRPPMTRDETGTLLGQTMGLVAATAGLFALGAYLSRDVSHQWSWLFYRSLQ